MASTDSNEDAAPKNANEGNNRKTSVISTSSEVRKQEIETGFGKVQVFIQGDLAEKDKRAVFLTVHDIGSNHSSFQDFIEQPCMCEVKARSIFIHVDLPGQSDGAPDFPDEAQFPTVQQMGEQVIPTILDALKVNLIVGLGEGAGANVLVRFAICHTSRVLGLLLIHLVTAGVGMLEKLKDTFTSGRRRPSEAFSSPDQVIALHRFGSSTAGSGSPGAGEMTAASTILSDSYKRRVASLNPKNLRKYVEAYMNRKDISDKLSQIKTLDVLLLAGSKSPYIQGVLSIHGKMDKGKTSLLKIDGVVDPLTEAPEKLAQSLLLFVKGLGYLTSLQLPGVDRVRTSSGGDGDGKSLGNIGRRRTLTMEEYDFPKPRRLSLASEGTE